MCEPKRIRDPLRNEGIPDEYDYRDGPFQIKLLAGRHRLMVGDAFSSLMSEPRMSLHEMCQIANVFNKAFASEPAIEALWKIRKAGRNSDTTAQWMQKVAAHGLEPKRWPAQVDQPPEKGNNNG